MSGTSPTTTTEDIPECPDCGKPQPLCICDNLAPVENRIEVLILQHPQEQDRLLGTARLTALQLTNATLKIGLSWSSLSKALGREVDPASWAILYLGSAKVAELETDREVVAIDRKGGLEHAQNAILNGIEGVVVLVRHLEPSQGAVVAKPMDAEVPARDPGSEKPVTLRQAAA
ncbi:hypothetical protein BN961_01522 [Afipia felis]|uniref:tRNA-uridine aminocarboxypropyltransferase n=1 Tax=Afipia felis TaxID=1035 RepID=A0A090ML14_AFIFE|nr:hypothetical protein BN961_01522 [Afipia felis]